MCCYRIKKPVVLAQAVHIPTFLLKRHILKGSSSNFFIWWMLEALFVTPPTSAFKVENIMRNFTKCLSSEMKGDQGSPTISMCFTKVAKLKEQLSLQYMCCHKLLCIQDTVVQEVYPGQNTNKMLSMFNSKIKFKKLLSYQKCYLKYEVREFLGSYFPTGSSQLKCMLFCKYTTFLIQQNFILLSQNIMISTSLPIISSYIY